MRWPRTFPGRHDVKPRFYVRPLQTPSTAPPLHYTHPASPPTSTFPSPASMWARSRLRIKRSHWFHRRIASKDTTVN